MENLRDQESWPCWRNLKIKWNRWREPRWNSNTNKKRSCVTVMFQETGSNSSFCKMPRKSVVAFPLARVAMDKRNACRKNEMFMYVHAVANSFISLPFLPSPLLAFADIWKATRRQPFLLLSPQGYLYPTLLSASLSFPPLDLPMKPPNQY